MEVQHPPRLTRAAVYVPASSRRMVLTAGIVVLYALILQSVYNTIGVVSKSSLDDFLVADEEEEDGDGFVEEDEDEDADFDNLFTEDEVIAASVGKNRVRDLERIKELAREHDRPLPSQSLPSALSAAALFFTVSMHILFHLMCHWRAEFRAFALFRPATEVKPGCSILCVPPRHKGKADISTIGRNDDGTLFFVFQRTIYTYAAGAVRDVRCPIDLPIDDYISARGLSTSDAAVSVKRFGTNRLSVSTPRFVDVWRKQLLSPIAMFQFFSSALWLLDSYWQYTAFQIFSILMLESTTAFQRLRTLGTLNKMSKKPKPVFVFRDKRWTLMSAESLQPGDLISLSVETKEGDVASSSSTTTTKKKNKATQRVVPCDCVVVRGNAVVNEATLTGESVPQMKDGLPLAGSKRRLDIDGRDRMHVLFSGTTVMMSSFGGGSAEPNSTSSISKPPNGGCVCYVLRTGFSSAQGEMVQLIEYSMESVSADNKETFLVLFILLCFAIAASGYVLKKGMEKGDRTTHELMLRCVIILTSVVPQHLPLQMAIAVNTALMSLMKKGIFCTEPFRVPIAGKVQHCLFDKTGTLTTDQLIAVGVINTSSRTTASKVASKTATAALEATHAARPDAQLVLSSCHSLVDVGGRLVGDPIESSALMGVRWNYDARTNTARPGNWAAEEVAVRKAAVELEAAKAGSEAFARAKKRLVEVETKLADVKQRSMRQGWSSKIVQRHHFASTLQRMSTVCHVKGHPTRPSKSGFCCLVKGSPETVQTLLADGAKPVWYESTYRKLAEKGMRVLALGLKWCGEEAASWTRSEVESDLEFVGFVAFSCIVRADSATVICALKESDHKVTMVTGDQPLTALHVAREVAICGKTNEGIQLIDGKWVPTSSTSKTPSKPFDPAKISQLAESFDLVVTEKALFAALETHDEDAIWQNIDAVRVFARMSPQGKARVVDALQTRVGQHVLMCGDGGNDVGALKQSDIGIALLSGYGNANTAKFDAAVDASAEDALNSQQVAMSKKSKDAAKIRKAAFAKRRKEIQAKQAVWIQEEIQKLQREGKGGVGAYWTAMKSAAARVQAELKAEQRKIAKAHGNAAFAVDDDAAAADPFAAMDSVMVRPGDASAAAPFTSRAPSVRSVVDLLRQGRCTLLSALQQQQIMVLECIISAFTLSVLSLEDARSSERQLMASGWLLSIASIAFSYSSPIDRMSKERPLNSLFHPAIAVSIAGQAAIHLACMVAAVRMATSAMGEEELAEVREFNRLARLGETEEQDLDEEDWMAEFNFLWSKPFRPNLLNTVVFLVETAQMNAVLFVNYKGRPWMKGMLENHALFMSVFVCVAAVASCAWGVFPEANAMLHLAPFPTDEFRWRVMALVAASLVGTFLWDRLVLALFARGIFGAMMREAAKTTPFDLVPIFMTLVKVLGGLLLLASGNPLLWIGAYFLYKRMTKDS